MAKTMGKVPKPKLPAMMQAEKMDTVMNKKMGTPRKEGKRS